MSLEENLQLRRAGQDCVGLDGVERNERISRSYHVCLVLSSLPSDGPFGFGSIWLTYQYLYCTCQYQSPVLLYIHI